MAISEKQQAIYDVMKAEKLLVKQGILDPKQKTANDKKIKEEKEKPNGMD